MGELRIGVWLADGQPGTQDGPKAPVKLPKANAAAGWGGDRLVSLDGPDGSWAIVWQTKWDTPKDIGQFVKRGSMPPSPTCRARTLCSRRTSRQVPPTRPWSC